MLSRAAEILRALHGERDGLSLSQLTSRTMLPRSTVYRLVSALQSEGFLVSVSSQGRVRIGPELMRLALSVRREIRQELRPELEALSKRIDETVDISILDGASARFIDQVAAPQRLRAVSAIGASFPLHCTANGKAMLASLPDDVVMAMLPTRLPRYTERTITTRSRLLAELNEIRNTRIAIDDQEHTVGIIALGMAIQDPIGTVAAISVPVPSQRFPSIRARADRELRLTAACCQMILTGEAAPE